MDWLDNIPATVTKDGYLRLIPENNETKTVEDVTPELEKAMEYAVANNFPGVLS